MNLRSVRCELGKAQTARVEHASDELRQGPNYIYPSDNPLQKCGTCSPFDNKAAGGCVQIMPGLVSASAREPWAAKDDMSSEINCLPCIGRLPRSHAVQPKNVVVAEYSVSE